MKPIATETIYLVILTGMREGHLRVLNRNDYLKYVNLQRPLANTGAQTCTIERAKTEGVTWRCVAVYHLTPEENQGKHIIFVDTLHENQTWVFSSDQPYTYLKVGWTWEGRRLDEPAPLRHFDKKLPEFKAQVDLYKNQTTSIWIVDDTFSSDIVHGLRSDVEAGEWGNTLFHNSFIVLFQLTDALTVVQPPPPVDPTEEKTVLVTLTAPTTIKVTGNFPFTVEYK